MNPLLFELAGVDINEAIGIFKATAHPSWSTKLKLSDGRPLVVDWQQVIDKYRGRGIRHPRDLGHVKWFYKVYKDQGGGGSVSFSGEWSDLIASIGRVVPSRTKAKQVHVELLPPMGA